MATFSSGHLVQDYEDPLRVLREGFKKIRGKKGEKKKKKKPFNHCCHALLSWRESAYCSRKAKSQRRKKGKKGKKESRVFTEHHQSVVSSEKREKWRKGGERKKRGRKV